jgi:hypothetical protein
MLSAFQAKLRRSPVYVFYWEIWERLLSAHLQQFCEWKGGGKYEKFSYPSTEEGFPENKDLFKDFIRQGLSEISFTEKKEIAEILEEARRCAADFDKWAKSVEKKLKIFMASEKAATVQKGKVIAVDFRKGKGS